MSWVDVLVLGLIGLLVLSRFLKFRLPRDTRPKDQRKGWREVMDRFQPSHPPRELPDEVAATSVQAQKTGQLRNKGKLLVPKGATGLAALKAVDPDFSEAAFLKGAKDAYVYFHEKWAAKDEDALANLCAPRLLDELADNHRGKAPGKAGEVKAAKIAGARLNGRTAIVDVDFEAKHGKKLLKSRWILARAVGSPDPNWELEDFKTK